MLLQDKEEEIMRLEGKSLKGDFLKFIIPSIIAQWVFTLYTMIDGMFVARGVSEVALTAVNLSYPFVAGMFSLSLLFAVGTSTVVAILLGEKNEQKANEVFTQNIVVLIGLSIILTIIVLLGLEPFALFLGATKSTLPYVKVYIGTLAPFAICFIISYTFEILIKTDGFPKSATIIVTMGAVFNCILDYLFVMVFHWGVFGAAFATGLSQAFVIIFYLRHFLKKMGVLRFAKFKMDYPLIWREFKNGIPSGITEFSAGIIIFFFNQAILRYLSEDALVSYTIISYINSIVIMSMAGVAQGCQPLIGYYFGQKNMEKCKKLFHYCLIASTVIAIVSFVGTFIGAKGIVSLFVSKELTELRIYSVKVFRIFIISFLIAGYNVIVGGYFTAVEEPVSAMIISIGRGIVTLLLSLLLLTKLFGGAGIWWAPTLSEAVCLVITIALFSKYKKNKKK